jgi:hypothetical protein
VTKAAQVPAFGLVDELAGATGAGVMAAQDVLQGRARPDGTFGKDYRSFRDAARTQEKTQEAENPAASAAGTGAGLLLSLLAPGPKTAPSIGRSVAEGALAGIGSSEGDLTTGQPGDLLRAGLDTALGGALGAAGNKLGKAAGRGLARLREMAGKKVAAAIGKATAMAGREEDALVATLQGKAGAETQKGSRMLENLRRIPGSASVSETPEMLLRAADAADQEAAQLAQKALASGVTEEVADSAGKLITPGSKLDAAAKASNQLEKLRRTAADLRQRAMGGGATQEGLEAARQAAIASPEAQALEHSVLGNVLEDYPGQAAKAQAARAAAELAAKGRDQAVAGRAQELLSRKTAAQALRARLLRYGAPALGSVVGSVLGGPVGSAVGALAGAGTRPMVRSFLRMAEDPAVASRLWGGIGRAAEVAPAGIDRLLRLAGRGAAGPLVGGGAVGAEPNDQEEPVIWDEVPVAEPPPAPTPPPSKRGNKRLRQLAAGR